MSSTATEIADAEGYIETVRAAWKLSWHTDSPSWWTTMWLVTLHSRMRNDRRDRLLGPGRTDRARTWVNGNRSIGWRSVRRSSRSHEIEACCNEANLASGRMLTKRGSHALKAVPGRRAHPLSPTSSLCGGSADDQESIEELSADLTGCLTRPSTGRTKHATGTPRVVPVFICGLGRRRRSVPGSREAVAPRGVRSPGAQRSSQARTRLSPAR